jgi:hypothetical protein
MAEDALADHIRGLEMELLNPGVRSSIEALSELLADDFVEFGSSGRRYSKQDILDTLPTESGLNFELSDFALRMLAPGVALATYQVLRSTAGGEPLRRSLRSSIWVIRDGRWQILFHQGTPMAG